MDKAKHPVVENKKEKRQKAKPKKVLTPVPKVIKTESVSVKTDSSSESSSTSHLTLKPKSKGHSKSSSSGESPILVSHKVLKPNYQWLPKGVPVKYLVSPVKVTILNAKKIPVNTKLISELKPGCKGNWVPKTN